MANLIVRDAEKAEIGPIARWLMENRAADPEFRRVTRSGFRRFLYGRFVTPRYLRQMINTWVLEQDGQMAGYALVEQRKVAVHVAEVHVQAGFDRAGLIAAALARAEALAHEAEYEFVSAAPREIDEQALAPYWDAGLGKLDYYLWAYEGVVSDVDIPQIIKQRPVMLKQALERRKHYLRLELEASNPPGRTLIEEVYFPSRPPRQAFELFMEAEPIGFLNPRPDERGDGVLTLAMSLAPQYWGAAWEAGIAAGFASAAGRGQPQPLRVLLSTTAHCEQMDAAFAALGLTRRLDRRPVLYKTITTA